MTTKTIKPLMILPYEAGCIGLSQEQSDMLFTPEEQSSDQIHGIIETFGPLEIIRRYNALVTSNKFDFSKYPVKHGPVHVYGKRQLMNHHGDGYALIGRVSISGKKYRAITSSQMFRLPNGHLLNVATIHAVGAAEDSTM